MGMANVMSILSWFVLLLAASGVMGSGVAGNTNEQGTTSCITSIFNFGDDLSDTGNYVLQNQELNVISTSPPRPTNLTWDQVNQSPNGVDQDMSFLHGYIRPNRTYGDVHSLPYGITFFNKPSGRFSNGRLIIDFMAESLGLPFLPPYLAGDKSLKNGVNFAVIGATVLDDVNSSSLSAPSTKNSLSVQMEWFKTLLPSLCSNFEDCQQFFGSSLFHVGGIGTYDYMLDKDSSELHIYMVPRVVSEITGTVNELISLGATQVMVAGLIPIGCLPRAQNNYPHEHVYDRNGCIYELNQVVHNHNALLQLTIQQLRELYPHVNIIYADYASASMRFINARRDEFGFTENRDTLSVVCCEARGLDAYLYENNAETCEMNNVCKNPESYIMWDETHMTEAAYQLMASSVISGNFTVPYFDMPARKCSSSH